MTGKGSRRLAASTLPSPVLDAVRRRPAGRTRGPARTQADSHHQLKTAGNVAESSGLALGGGR